MPGPLSVQNDRAKFASLDTAEKRMNAGAFTTGKTEKNLKKGAPMSEDNGACPKNLARRIRAFDKAGDRTPTKIHRPGSMKK